MNLTLSKRGDYVVRSALCLARAYPAGRYRKIREVVAEMGVPQTFASQILKDLVKAGLADSKAGKEGGYRLAKAPEVITMLSVVEAGEGPLRSDRCGLGEGPCRWDSVCPLHETWTQATAALRKVLSASTLADLVTSDLAIEAGNYHVPRDSHRRGIPPIKFSDWVQVEMARSRIVESLYREAWLAPLVKNAFDEVDALRIQLDPSGPVWTSAHVDVAITTPIDSKVDPEDSSDLEIALSWESSTLEGLSSHGDALLRLISLDPERTEIRVTGDLRPPLPHNINIPDSDDPSRGILQRLADALVRSSLRRVAGALEDQLARTS